MKELFPISYPDVIIFMMGITNELFSDDVFDIWTDLLSYTR